MSERLTTTMSGFFSSLKLDFGRHRVPLILQTEAAECGLASLAMVAAYHGLHTDMPTLRQRFSLSLKGATMVDLTRMAGQLKLNPRALRAELEHLYAIDLVCDPDVQPFYERCGLRPCSAMIVRRRERLKSIAGG